MRDLGIETCYLSSPPPLREMKKPRVRQREDSERRYQGTASKMEKGFESEERKQNRSCHFEKPEVGG